MIRRNAYTSLKKEVRVPFRFHPDSTDNPRYTYAGMQIKSIVRNSATGKFLVTLRCASTKIISVSAALVTATAPAVNSLVTVFDVNDGPSVTENNFGLQLYVAGSANDPTYSADTFICGEVVLEMGSVT